MSPETQESTNSSPRNSTSKVLGTFGVKTTDGASTLLSYSCERSSESGSRYS